MWLNMWSDKSVYVSLWSKEDIGLEHCKSRQSEHDQIAIKQYGELGEFLKMYCNKRHIASILLQINSLPFKHIHPFPHTNPIIFPLSKVFLQVFFLTGSSCTLSWPSWIDSTHFRYMITLWGRHRSSTVPNPSSKLDEGIPQCFFQLCLSVN